MAYLLGVLCIGFGAGNVFSFLFWHLQVGKKTAVPLLLLKNM
jgi:hypothetical protein